MGETVRAVVATGAMIAGMALVSYAGYRQYVALPEEQAMRHVITRAAIVLIGLLLAFVGAGALR